MTKHPLVILSFIVAFLWTNCHRSQEKTNPYAHLPQALQELYRQVEKNPDEAKLYLQLSDYYLSHSQLDSALNHVLIAIRLDSTQSEYYLLLSDVYFAQQRIDETEEILEKVIGMDPESKDAYLKLAELHFLHKRYKEAHENISAVLKLDVYNPKAYFIRGWIYKEEGDTMAAIRSYLTAVEQNPDYFEAYEELGIVYHAKKDPLAVNYYTNALNLQADNTQIMYNIAMFYQEKGDNDKALNYYHMILQIDGEHPHALHNIGWIYLVRKDKYEEAVAFFTRAIEADSTYIEAIYNRGLAFESMQRYDYARQDYAFTLKFFENNMPAIEGLNRMDKAQNR